MGKQKSLKRCLRCNHDSRYGDEAQLPEPLLFNGPVLREVYNTRVGSLGVVGRPDVSLVLSLHIPADRKHHDGAS